MPLICQAAYTSSQPVTLADPMNFPSTRVWSFQLEFPALILGLPELDRKFLIDVLRCENNDSGVFYTTRGRRANSVYFVRRITANSWGLPDHYVLDDNFESDIELPYDFSELANSFAEAIRPHLQPVIQDLFPSSLVVK